MQLLRTSQSRSMRQSRFAGASCAAACLRAMAALSGVGSMLPMVIVRSVTVVSRQGGARRARQSQARRRGDQRDFMCRSLR